MSHLWFYGPQALPASPASMTIPWLSGPQALPASPASMSMVVGVVLVLLGLLLTFRGAALMRLLITVWGGLLGLSLGAGLVASATGEPLLSTPTSWVVGVIAALVFAVLAYAFYVIGVLLALGSCGFAVGGAAAEALGVADGWPVFGIAIAAGVLLAVVGLVLNAPRLLLAVLSALGGAAITIAGAMVLAGVATVGVSAADPAGFSLPDPIGLWWSVGYLVLAGAGLLSQLTSGSSGPTRRQWSRQAATAAPARVH